MWVRLARAPQWRAITYALEDAIPFPGKRQPIDTVDLTFIGGGFSTAETLRLLCERLVNSQAAFCAKQRMQVRVLESHSGASRTLGSGLPYGDRTHPAFLLSGSLQYYPEFYEWWCRSAEKILPELVASNDPLVDSWLRVNRPLFASKQFEDIHLPRRIFGRFAGARTCTAVHRASKAGVLTCRTICGEAVNITQDKRGYRITLASRDFLYSRMVVLAVGNTWQRIPPHLVSEPRYFLSMSDGSLARLSREGPRLLAGLRRKQRRILLIGSRGSALEWLHYLRHQPELIKLTSEISVLSPQGEVPKNPVDYYRSVETLSEMGLLVFYRGHVSQISRARTPDQPLQIHVKEALGAQPVIDSAAIVIRCTGRGPIEYSTSRLLNNLASQSNHFPTTIHKDSFVVGSDCEIRDTPNVFIIGPLLTPHNFGEGVDSINIVTRVAAPLSDLLRVRHTDERSRVAYGRAHHTATSTRWPNHLQA